MATAGPIAPSVQPQLCDYCHQKPKFSNHSYCSKTCASQAATLCNHCHKKPKFQNFEFCGKNCAQLAGPSTKPRAAAPSTNPTNGQAGSRGNKNNGNVNANQGAFDPVQLAKLVAQHIPQVQAMFAGSANPGPAPPIITNPFATPAPAPQAAPSGPQNNPFLPPSLQQGPAGAAGAYQTQATGGGPVPLGSNGAPAVPSGNVANVPSSSSVGAQHVLVSSNGQQQSAAPAECVIPGCGQPVHVDAKGLKSSEYCSMRHREEAVALGLAPPCIMCLIMPQSDTDYFCGRACKEEATNKGLVHYDDRGEQ